MTARDSDERGLVLLLLRMLGPALLLLLSSAVNTIKLRTSTISGDTASQQPDIQTVDTFQLLKRFYSIFTDFCNAKVCT